METTIRVRCGRCFNRIIGVEKGEKIVLACNYSGDPIVRGVRKAGLWACSACAESSQVFNVKVGDKIVTRVSHGKIHLAEVAEIKNKGNFRVGRDGIYNALGRRLRGYGDVWLSRIATLDDIAQWERQQAAEAQERAEKETAAKTREDAKQEALAAFKAKLPEDLRESITDAQDWGTQWTFTITLEK